MTRCGRGRRDVGPDWDAEEYASPEDTAVAVALGLLLVALLVWCGT